MNVPFRTEHAKDFLFSTLQQFEVISVTARRHFTAEN